MSTADHDAAWRLWRAAGALRVLAAAETLRSWGLDAIADGIARAACVVLADVAVDAGTAPDTITIHVAGDIFARRPD